MNRLKRALFAALAVGSIAIAACGGGGTPSPTATFPPDFTPMPPELLTPAPPPPIDADAQLDPFTNHDPAYTISIPHGWTIDEGKSSGMTTFTYSTAARGIIAVTTINCAGALTGGTDPLSVLRDDTALVQSAKLPLTSGKAEHLTVNGRDAYLVPYSVSLGETQAYQFVYYIAGDQCTWRVRNVVYGTTPGDGYDRLFARMAHSFTPQ